MDTALALQSYKDYLLAKLEDDKAYYEEQMSELSWQEDNPIVKNAKSHVEYIEHTMKLIRGTGFTSWEKKYLEQGKELAKAQAKLSEQLEKIDKIYEAMGVNE